jgi:hypothetical protein
VVTEEFGIFLPRQCLPASSATEPLPPDFADRPIELPEAPGVRWTSVILVVASELGVEGLQLLAHRLMAVLLAPFGYCRQAPSETGAKKVHSLIDKMYKRKNLEMAWERVKANRGSGGVDGETLETFEAQLGQQLDRLQRELKEDTYQPQPVRQHPIPKRDKPGEYRLLGIPTIYDRVCQQALLNRLEPIFEPIFDDASFGYPFFSGLCFPMQIGHGE